jgi:hypothetical protein
MLYGPCGSRDIKAPCSLRLFTAMLLAALCMDLTACRSLDRQSPQSGISGAIHGGQQPIAGALIQLYAVGTTADGSASTPLIATTVTTSDGTGTPNFNANAGNANNTLPNGYFTITGDYNCPSAGTQVYLVATGGNPGLSSVTNNPQIALAAALGNCGDLSASTTIDVNELTTIASIAPVFSFMNSYSSLGAAPANAGQLVTNLSRVAEYTDTSTGTVPGPALPAGYYASSVEIRTLGDVLAACVNSAGGVAGDASACGQLFQLAALPGNAAPTDTIQAVLSILKNPAANTTAIYDLAPPTAPFQPTLATAPQSWALPITVDGTPAQLAFSTQPANSPATGALAPVVVTIEDGNGNPVPTATGLVSIAIGSNPSQSSLGGTVVVNAINGTATFSNLSITKAAAGYTLTASLGSLQSATSAGFSILPGAPAQLAFAGQLSGNLSATVNPFIVLVEDQFGNRATSSVQVTVTLGSNPSGSTLSGTRTVSASSGQASFSHIGISYPGSGYTLTVSSPGLTSTSSNSFNVVGSIVVNTPFLDLGRTGTLSVSIFPVAPPGGQTITLASDNPSVVSVPSSVLIPAGATTPATQPIISGGYLGTANITASAPNFATKSNSVSVSTTLSASPQSITTYQGLPSNATINISDIAPPEGLILNLSTDNPAFVSVPPTVTIPAGGSSAPVTLTGTGVGTTTLRIDYPGNQEGTASVQTLATPPVAIAATDPSFGSIVVVGNNMYTALKLSVPAGPPTDETVTLTSSDPTHFLLSTDATKVGSASIAVLLPRNTTILPNVYLQGQNYSGSTGIASMITTTAPIYANNSTIMTLYPSGLSFGGFGSGTLSTTTVSLPTSVGPYLTVVTPGSLQVQSYGSQFLGPQAAPLSYTVTSSNMTVGIVMGSPATIPVGSDVSLSPPEFQPVGIGTTTLSLSQPAGYYAGSFPTVWSSQLTATVAPAAISITSPIIGNNTYTQLGFDLLGRPPQNETMTVTSSDPTHFLLTTDPTVPGSASIAIQLGQNDPNIPSVYVQGQNFSGSAIINGTITASAPNYASGIGMPGLYPTGIGFVDTAISTSATSGAIRLHPTVLILNPATLAYIEPATALNPQAGPLLINISSSNPSLGTIVNTPATIPVGLATSTNSPSFQPVADGTVNISITQPAGYSSPTASFTDDLIATITN